MRTKYLYCPNCGKYLGEAKKILGGRKKCKCGWEGEIIDCDKIPKPKISITGGDHKCIIPGESSGI